MMNSYMNDRDLYATMAAEIYHNKYEDNKEFYPDGTMNPEGAVRRSNMKQLLLGIMYGRGAPSIAEQIKNHDGPVTNEDIKEAQGILNNFFKSFPKVKKWIDKTTADAKVTGYVEDAWGRKRRLPDIQLPKVEVFFENGFSTSEFNPLLGSKSKFSNHNSELVENYITKAEKCKSRKDMEALKQKAKQDGIVIKDNSGFISQAERQCVNARVQGGAASMSKRAMINIYNNQELKDLGYKILIVVHDEIIGECPEENQERVKQLVSQLMIESAKPECIVPMKCDAESFYHWYENVYKANLLKEQNKLLSTNDKEKALEILYNNHEECTKEQIQILLG